MHIMGSSERAGPLHFHPNWNPSSVAFNTHYSMLGLNSYCSKVANFLSVCHPFLGGRIAFGNARRGEHIWPQDFGSYPDRQHVQAVMELFSRSNEGRGSQSERCGDVSALELRCVWRTAKLHGDCAGFYIGALSGLMSLGKTEIIHGCVLVPSSFFQVLRLYL